MSAQNETPTLENAALPQSRWSFEVACGRRPAGPSTLLIPRRLLNELERRCADSSSRGAGVAGLLANILERSRALLQTGLLPHSEQLNCVYQPQGEDLARINFRPNESDWILLGQAAAAHGVSRCRMFVLLLELDIVDAIDAVCEAQELSPLEAFDRDYPGAIRCLSEQRPSFHTFERSLSFAPIDLESSPAERVERLTHEQETARRSGPIWAYL